MHLSRTSGEFITEPSMYGPCQLGRIAEIAMSDPPNIDDRAAHGSLWEKTATPVSEYSTLAGEVAADVCVVGAGFTGLSAALHLTEAGTNVAVVEAGDIGWGASGRTGGHVIAGLKRDPDEVERLLGVKRWRHRQTACPASSIPFPVAIAPQRGNRQDH